MKECDGKDSKWWLWDNREHFGLQISHLKSSDNFTLLNHFSLQYQENRVNTVEIYQFLGSVHM